MSTATPPGLRVCTRCGYGRGFHVCFEPVDGEHLQLGLICPSCGQSYRLGLLIPAADAVARPGEIF